MIVPRPPFWMALLGLYCGQAAVLAADPAPGPRVNYSRDVKPLLAARCYACHGPDAGQRQAEMRLDERDGAVPKVITPGDAAASPLILRVTTDNTDEQMPPPDSKLPPLSPAEVDVLQRWIDQGANFDVHWAYVPPVRPDVPPAADAWPRNDIDRFIAAGHAANGLSPAAEADRRTLIRRLSFDLTGLPPTPEEVAAFLADADPHAYEHLVERLLSSPHYGERMAIYWLDLVRYADTTGIHGDNHREISPYRDYVIAAFNDNKPFDQFTREQLAGDLLPESDNLDKIASGYNRLLMTTTEGGAQAKEYVAKYSADRVRNATSVWLGATLGCAECHDHKFDPYTTRDFYRFAAFFADIQEIPVGLQTEVRLPLGEKADQIAALDAQLPPLQAVLDAPTPELSAAQAEWEGGIAARQVAWEVLAPSEMQSAGGATLTRMDDGSILVAGTAAERDTYTLSIPLQSPGITALRLEVLPEDSLPARGPGRAANGNFVIHEFRAAVGGQPVVWNGATATHSQPDWSVSGAADGNSATGWAILDHTGRPNEAVFECQADIGSACPTTLTVTIEQNFGGAHTLGRFRLSATTAPRPVTAGGLGGLPPEVSQIVAIPAEQRDAGQLAALSAYYRTIAPLLEPVRQQLAQLQQQRDGLLATVPATLVSVSVEPRPIRILPRGNWQDDSGDVVLPGAPNFLPQPQLGDRRATRLDLAEWLVAPENPLVARVFVNRLWKLLYGEGLVRSLEDFGTQGTLPTHPELLDWLAVEFIDSGWDVKHVLRLMAASATYRQSSQADGATRERDPRNQWLARQSRFRLEAEMVRDNALAVSGLLVDRLGGPSVKPYQPAGYWAHLNFPVREWQSDHGEALYRRGLYTYWCRTFLHPSMRAFDASTREECSVERPRSSTPLQALALLNDPIYIEAARVLAERIVREGGATDEQRLAWAYRQTLARDARPEEQSVLLALRQKHLDAYAADPAAAEQLIHTGEWPVPADIPPADLAAWTSVARVILNLHESVTRF